MEAFVASPPHHGHGQPTEFPELLLPHPAEAAYILKQAPIHNRHRVKPQELKTHGTQVDALHRPIAHAGRAEGAAVAAPVAQNPPGVSETVAVFPSGR